MNKEVLYNLGLSEWQVEKILCIHGSEVSELKREIKELKKDSIPTRGKAN